MTQEICSNALFQSPNPNYATIETAIISEPPGGLTSLQLPGRFRFQVNIANLFNRRDIIPVRLSTSALSPDGYEVPGGRGLALSRYDLVAPRELRFTTTYSF